MDYRLKQRQARLREMCGKYVYPWIIGLAEKYKQDGIYPLFLGDYYTERLDKETAEVVGLLIPIRNPAKRDAYITELRNIIGHHPWEMICNRKFLHIAKLSTVLGNQGINGVTLFNLLDWFWEVCCQDKIPLEYVVLGELGIIKRYHKRSIREIIDFKDLNLRLQILLAKMTLCDGFGVGLWNFLPPEDVPCPMLDFVSRFLKSYYLIENGRLDEAIDFIGFKKPCDALFASMEYNRQKKENEKSFIAQEMRLKKWYKGCRLRYNFMVKV